MSHSEKLRANIFCCQECSQPKFIRSLLGALLTVFALSFTSVAGMAATGDLEVLFVGQQVVEGENAISITFSEALAPDQDINRFLSLTDDKIGRVDGAWIMAPKANVVYFTNIEAATSYEISNHPTVKSSGSVADITNLLNS